MTCTVLFLCTFRRYVTSQNYGKSLVTVKLLPSTTPPHSTKLSFGLTVWPNSCWLPFKYRVQVKIGLITYKIAILSSTVVAQNFLYIPLLTVKYMIHATIFSKLFQPLYTNFLELSSFPHKNQSISYIFKKHLETCSSTQTCPPSTLPFPTHPQLLDFPRVLLS